MTASPLAIIVCRVAVLVMVLAWTVRSEAQVAPRTIAGVVRDTAGRPLANAVVALDPTEAVRATRADAQGRFRFTNVSPGRHELRTTWLGYQPDERTVEVPAAGLELVIILSPLAFQLDTLAIVARRTGVFGTTVMRSDLRTLGGVDVDVLTTRWRTRTGADGRFAFPELTEGAYVLLGRRNGFATRILPVPVPRDDAVEVALAMDSAATKAQQIANNRLQDLRTRTNWRRPSLSALVPRQELLPRRGQSLDIALRYAPSFLYKALIFNDVECIYVDGLPRPGMRAKDFAAEDVAMVEVYASGGGTSATDMERFRQSGFECGVGPTRVEFETDRGTLWYNRAPRPGIVSIVHIWLK